MNRLYYVGPFYWIIRDTGKKGEKVIGWGFMRQTSPPWKTGRGPHIRMGKFSLQFGVAKNGKVSSDEHGLLYAMGGRIMDTKPTEIGDWP